MTTTRITLNPADTIATINPNIYGHFAEHLGRCIYDGIWVGEDSAIPNIGGFCTDIIEALRRLKPPIIRWPAAASVTGVFLLRQHFFSIPSDLEDAARVDGAGRFRTFWQVCLPLVTNSLTALAIFTFLGLWNDLFWPLIVLTRQFKLTLPIGLLVLQQGSYIQRGLAYAGAFIATMPVLVFYTIFQRRIIAGITMAGMAGQ